MDAVERFLCVASHPTGYDFMRNCADMGIKVTVLTLDQHRDADWPRECLEELATMPPGLNREQILNTVSWMARSKRFDRIVALHEQDLETAAQIREHMRVPGMGATTAGCYRDLLAQRVIARAFGYPVPEFCRVLNYDQLRDFMARVPGPWVLRPRSDESFGSSPSIHDPEHLWRMLEQLGDAQSHYILEQIVTGDVFHVASIVSESEVKFSVVLQGGTLPLRTFHDGDVISMTTVERDSREAKELTAMNRALAPSLGMVRGVTQAAFLRTHAGNFYFLGIAAGVGGAPVDENQCSGSLFGATPFIDKLVEASTGVNLWREWAALEAGNFRHVSYPVPDSFEGYAGSILRLLPGTGRDLESMNDPAIVSRVRNRGHAGLILRAASPQGVQNLIEEFRERLESQTLPSASEEQR